jgi:hypothetical protein
MIDLSSLKTIYNNTIDGLLSANGLAVPCSIVFEDPKGEECPNCYINPVTGRSSCKYTQQLAETNTTTAAPILPNRSDIYILLIDENSNTADFPILNSGLSLFKSAFPDLLMFVLDVTPYNPSYNILYPTDYAADEYLFSSRLNLGEYVLRDSGNPVGATDSYQLILDMINDPSTPAYISGIFASSTTVSVATDGTGSTPISDIQATYDNLLVSLSGAGKTVVTNTSVNQEDILCSYVYQNCFDQTSEITQFINFCDGVHNGEYSDNFCIDYVAPTTSPPEPIDPAIEASGQYIWFPEGHVCPVCNGIGAMPTTTTTSQDIVVIFDNKKFINFGNVNVPVGDMQTITPISMYTELKTADYIIVDTNVTPYAQNKFTRISEPQPVGLGDNRYIFTNWERSA